MNQQWEPYVTVVMGVISGTEAEREAVRFGIIADYGEAAWSAILSEALERFFGVHGTARSMRNGTGDGT